MTGAWTVAYERRPCDLPHLRGAGAGMTCEQAEREAVARLLATHGGWRSVRALRDGRMSGLDTVRDLWGCGWAQDDLSWDCIYPTMHITYRDADGERQRFEITKARAGKLAEQLARVDAPRQLSMFEMEATA